MVDPPGGIARALLVTIALPLLSGPAVAEEAADRVRNDTQRGQPLVAHVVVALCDNVNQGIVPVPVTLGNGQDPARNLYWGAAFGVRTYFSRANGWERRCAPAAARTWWRSWATTG